MGGGGVLVLREGGGVVMCGDARYSPSLSSSSSSECLALFLGTGL